MYINFKSMNKDYVVIEKYDIFYLASFSEEDSDKELLDNCNKILNIISDTEREFNKDNVASTNYIKKFIMEKNDPLCEYLVEKYKKKNPNYILDEMNSMWLINSLHFALVHNYDELSNKLISIIKEAGESRKFGSEEEFRKMHGNELTDFVLEHSHYNYELNENEFDDKEPILLLKDGEFIKINLNKEDNVHKLVLSDNTDKKE